jgi:hypothetical protein
MKSRFSTDVSGQSHPFHNAVSLQCPFSSLRGDSSNTEMTALTRNASQLRGSPQQFQVAPRRSPTNKRQRKKKTQFCFTLTNGPSKLAAEQSTSTANERTLNHRKTFSNVQKDFQTRGTDRIPNAERKEGIRAELNGRTKTDKNDKRSNRGQSRHSSQAETIGRLECRDRTRIRKGAGDCLSLLSHARAGKT